MKFHCVPMADRTSTNLVIQHSWILNLDQQSWCPPFKMRDLKRTASMQKEVASKVIAMFKWLSEAEMDCEFICITKIWCNPIN